MHAPLALVDVFICPQMPEIRIVLREPPVPLSSPQRHALVQANKTIGLAEALWSAKLLTPILIEAKRDLLHL